MTEASGVSLVPRVWQEVLGEAFVKISSSFLGEAREEPGTQRQIPTTRGRVAVRAVLAPTMHSVVSSKGCQPHCPKSKQYLEVTFCCTQVLGFQLFVMLIVNTGNSLASLSLVF